MNLARALGHEAGSSPCRTEHQSCFVVDDDVSVRESLELLIRFEGWLPEIFRVRAGISQPPTSPCSELPHT